MLKQAVLQRKMRPAVVRNGSREQLSEEDMAREEEAKANAPLPGVFGL